MAGLLPTSYLIPIKSRKERLAVACGQLQPLQRIYIYNPRESKISPKDAITEKSTSHDQIPYAVREEAVAILCCQFELLNHYLSIQDGQMRSRRRTPSPRRQSPTHFRRPLSLNNRSGQSSTETSGSTAQPAGQIEKPRGSTSRSLPPPTTFHTSSSRTNSHHRMGFHSETLVYRPGPGLLCLPGVIVEGLDA